ncbi:hypothetical protein K450DRAFT_254014 [Umbelopsis ramanniana AG]|uniref:D-xylose 1-dehydrogenase (NADP(+), D-xylono-1,5-lactone-forming) n=1 Tax=Umbelopsis ramanniana AG TaxID=1314678 RepID=A0AAD5HBN6_UMBRA|nr:uncharacterized protein K450DRAFT_254014 [Umbelopsis ramanniana AG]KAI8577019.1 hypothetical protein K450DRAFT_254014 [Umbelopsis ramanniana AG]
MNTTTPFVVRWAIIGAGWISEQFVHDLAMDPSTRDVKDVAHAVVAVDSRTKAKAEAFIRDYCPEGGFAQKAGYCDLPVEAVEGYDAVYAREDVDCVYIGTPHNDHYFSAKAALEAKKHVLCEKPSTINAGQMKELAALAQANGLFFMEAVWTRFFPLMYALQKDIHETKVLGDIHQVNADFSIKGVGRVPLTHRLLNPDLAGGAILDLGPYPLTWGLMTLFHHPDNKLSPPTAVSSSMQLHPETGVDIFTTVVLDFPKMTARANLTCNLVVESPADCTARIQGTKGEIIVPRPAPRPEKYIIRLDNGEETVKEFAIPGNGYHWEADAVARCLRDGLKECERMTVSESIMSMELMDEFRKQGGYEFPASLAQ